MKVLVIGSGGREHALAWKISQSPRIKRLWVAPGNAGTALDAENVPIAADDIKGLYPLLKRKSRLGRRGTRGSSDACIVDAMAAEKIRTFGPSRAAAQLEGSKAFCKLTLRQADVPRLTIRCFAMRIAPCDISKRVTPTKTTKHLLS